MTRSLSTHLLYGFWVGATPDSRKAWQMIGYGVDPLCGEDIGTTIISAIAVNTQNGIVIETITEKNDCQMAGRFPFDHVQDPEKILSKAISLVRRLTESHAPVSCICVTGQMHGIVYRNSRGNAVSCSPGHSI